MHYYELYKVCYQITANANDNLTILVYLDEPCEEISLMKQ